MERRPRGSSVEDAGSYTGYDGHYEGGKFVFASKEERDRYLVATYGYLRNGYREPEEPTDERPPILYGACKCAGCRRAGAGTWHDETERMAYQAAVEGNPRRDGEGPMAYSQRVAAAVEGKYQQAGMTMPRRGLSQREWAARQWEVRKSGGHAHYVEGE